MRRLSTVLILSCIINYGYCWNALGHRLIAQIAYPHLTAHAKQVYNQYNHALDNVYRPQNLVNAAAWLDSLRYQNESWLQEKHYINLPFSPDGTPLLPPNKINAISAIAEAKASLQSNSSTNFAKGFSLRILLHVVGDLHQPMHAVNRFTADHPKGDQGGNLVHLGRNRIATNLHTYWDKGGGFLAKSRHYSNRQLRKKAYTIEKHWPCELTKMNLDPKTWAQESYEIAVNKAYQLKAGQKPNKTYQHMVKNLTEQRIALAGCRLAAMLNKLA
jgi:S1/P1 Nuclease